MAKQTFTTGQVLTAAQMTSLQQTAMGGGSTTAKTASYVLVAADAGTVVQMNAAGATTITVNTALFAAGDTVQIQNVGAGVCTVTAGTATVSTSATLALKQYDAGSLYFNTTSAAIFFAVDAADGMANVLTTTGDIIYSSSGTTAARLGIGSSAQVLTVSGGVPSWATPAASASGLTKISSATYTSVSNTGTTFDGVFTSTYDNYIIIFQALNSVTNSNVNFQWQLRNGGTTTTTQYNGTYSRGVTLTSTSAASSFNVCNLTTNTDQQGAIYMSFYRNTKSMSWNYLGNDRGVSDSSIVGGGFQNTLSALGADGFILSSSAGTLSGTTTVYGVQK